MVGPASTGVSRRWGWGRADAALHAGQLPTHPLYDENNRHVPRARKLSQAEGEAGTYHGDGDFRRQFCKHLLSASATKAGPLITYSVVKCLTDSGSQNTFLNNNADVFMGYVARGAGSLLPYVVAAESDARSAEWQISRYDEAISRGVLESWNNSKEVIAAASVTLVAAP